MPLPSRRPIAISSRAATNWSRELRNGAPLATNSAWSAVSTSVSLVVRLLRVAGDADAHRDVRARVVGDRVDRQPDPPRDLLGGLAAAVGQDHGELVAAVAIGPVALADAALDGPADGDQQLVAGGMAVPVVVALEPVEIHHQDRDRPGRAAAR